MSDAPQSERTSWWQTVPGMLTAAAGLITAITGLLLAVHQMGFLQHSSKSPPTRSAESRSSDSQSQPNPTGSEASAGDELPLPSETEVHSGDSVYKLLSAKLENYAPGQKALHVKIRMTHSGRFDANFWAASFRLAVNGLLQPPLGDLDDIVASHSSKEAELIFVVPAEATTAGLQMGDVGEGKPAIPLDLRARIK